MKPDVTIRAAVEADVPAIVAMAKRIAAQSAYQQGVVPDPPHVTRVARGMVESPDAVILLAVRADRVLGLLALARYGHLLSGDARVAQVCWWVDLDARGDWIGLELLKAGEAWARRRGATHLDMTAPSPQFAHVFQRRGYVETGRSFERSL